MKTEAFDALLETLKKAAAALREEDIPFLLGGGLACWVRGGPESDHDLDFMLKEGDAERALDALVRQGMRPEKPPEGWLYKAWDDGVLVDLIFRPSGFDITDEVIERGEDLEVVSTPMRVMRLEDVFAAKLLALDEHNLDCVRRAPSGISGGKPAVTASAAWRQRRRISAPTMSAASLYPCAERGRAPR